MQGDLAPQSIHIAASSGGTNIGHQQAWMCGNFAHQNIHTNSDSLHIKGG